MQLEKIMAEIDNLYVDETDFGIECNMENRSDVACDNCYECIKEACKNIIRKHMNDGWISVKNCGLPKANEDEFRFWVTIQYKRSGFRRTIKATWSYYDKCFLHQNGKKILQDVVAYQYYFAPEPYRPERSV